MNFKRVVGAGCLAASVSACCSSPEKLTGDPNKTIGLTPALVGLVDSLEAMKAKLHADHAVLGAFPCKITAQFNLTATASDSITGGGSAGGGVGGVTLAVNLSDTQSNTGTRGSQISIELDSIACLSKDSIGATKPENIDKLWNIMAHLQPDGSGNSMTTEEQQRLNLNHYNEHYHLPIK